MGWPTSRNPKKYALEPRRGAGSASPPCRCRASPDTGCACASRRPARSTRVGPFLTFLRLGCSGQPTAASVTRRRCPSSGCGARISTASGPGAGSGPVRPAAVRPAAAASCHRSVSRLRPRRLPRGVGARGGELHESSRRPRRLLHLSSSPSATHWMLPAVSARGCPKRVACREAAPWAAATRVARLAPGPVSPKSRGVYTANR